jgi:predicted DNA-binding transcriptional regulator YafY
MRVIWRERVGKATTLFKAGTPWLVFLSMPASIRAIVSAVGSGCAAVQGGALRYDRRVGSHSNTETIVAIFKALLDQRTWKQADLARHVGVSTATLHKRLCELQASSIPLESEREHPHVFWSVPKSWYPGGVLFTGEQVMQVFRQLSRLPKSKARDALIESLLKYVPSRKASQAVVPAETTPREEHHLPIIEDGAEHRVSLRFSYFTAHRGSEGTRHASVHRVLLGPPARFVATCHRTDELKWFRVDNVLDSKLDTAEAFRAVDSKVVDAYVRASLDGFNEGGRPSRHVFFVRDPSARWVARNLIEEMQFEEVPGGIRVTVETSAIQRLARFVVGLGDAATPLTAPLELAVAALARGALASIASKVPT